MKREQEQEVLQRVPVEITVTITSHFFLEVYDGYAATALANEVKRWREHPVIAPLAEHLDHQVTVTGRMT
jgi:hypothetical protein